MVPELTIPLIKTPQVSPTTHGDIPPFDRDLFLKQIQKLALSSEEKAECNQNKMKELTKKYDLCEFESEKLGKKAKELEKEVSKTFGESISLKENMKKSLAKNK